MAMLIKQSGWGGEIVFVIVERTVTYIVSNTAQVDFVKVGDKLYGSHTVLVGRHQFPKMYPELTL